jgi:hypothetical protein
MNPQQTGQPAHKGSEALRAAVQARADKSATASPGSSCSIGAHKIASVVLPFLERAAAEIMQKGGRLEYGVRKFDVATGEKFSVYFRLVDTPTDRASWYYIVDLSAPTPLVLKTDSLDIGSNVRRREICSLNFAQYGDITSDSLKRLLQLALDEAG